MMELILGGLSAAGSLFSGLGARQAAKSQQRRQDAYDAMARLANAQLSETIMREVPKNISRDAAIAGFNPVTWLNAGALGYYTNAYGLQQWSPSQAINIPSIGQAVGSAITSGANAFGQQYRFEQKLGFEQSALAAKIGAFSGRSVGSPTAAAISPVESALGGAGGAIFSAGGLMTNRGAGGLSLKSVPPSWKAGRSDNEDDDPAPGEYGEEGQKVKFTRMFPDRPMSNLLPDAETAETRYGEGAISEGYSWWVGANDVFRNATRRSGMFTADGVDDPGTSVGHTFRRMRSEIFGYPIYDDGARGKSWGLPDKTWVEAPNSTRGFAVMPLEQWNTSAPRGWVTGGSF